MREISHAGLADEAEFGACADFVARFDQNGAFAHVAVLGFPAALIFDGDAVATFFASHEGRGILHTVADAFDRAVPAASTAIPSAISARQIRAMSVLSSPSLLSGPKVKSVARGRVCSRGIAGYGRCHPRCNPPAAPIQRPPPVGEGQW